MRDLLNLLDDVLGPHLQSGSDEYYWQCPFCRKPKKFAINLTKKAWHCWVCQERGGKLYSLFHRLRASAKQMQRLAELVNEPIHVPRAPLPDRPVELPDEFLPLWKPAAHIGWHHATQYLAQRGITEYDILRYQLGFCAYGPYRNRVIIPSYTANGTLNYFVARDIYDNQHLKYRNPPTGKDVVMFDLHINWQEPIVICEGVFDAMAIKRNAVPILGKFIPKTLRTKIAQHNVKTIYLALDADAMDATLTTANQFMRDGREVYVVAMQDKDPSVVGFQAMRQLIAHAEKLTFFDLIKLRVSM